MVLPPTGLTTLLRSTEFTPEAIVAALRANGCLTLAARVKPEPVRKLIGEVLISERNRPPMPGPSTTDMIARALRDSPFLSEKGRRLDGSPPQNSWYRRWRDTFAGLWNRRAD
ncbi:MAG: hypothetical protein ABI742_06015 [Gemmatimonadota bacterium]